MPREQLAKWFRSTEEFLDGTDMAIVPTFNPLYWYVYNRRRPNRIVAGPLLKKDARAAAERAAKKAKERSAR